MTIVVTGLGAVTALGESARITFDRILLGERAFGEVTLFDPGDARAKVVAQVGALPASAGSTSGSSRTTELALVAAREALADAGLDPRRVRTGLVLGGSTAGLFQTETELVPLLAERATDPARIEAALARMPSHLLTGPTDYLASALGPFVRTRSLSSACSSGANALAIGAAWLELGLVDAVLCGGADALCRVTFSGFNALAAVDPTGARPFDVRRRGLTLGEGAGMLVLERGEGRSSRSRPAICSLLGWAARSEAHHITNPEPTGEAPFQAMKAALARAGIRPSDIDYVNAHGTGTPLNDPMESRALARLFGEDLARVPVSTQKGMIGHTLAAAGAIEAAITALAIERGVVPPTGGLEQPDPQCPLRHVLVAEERPIGAALSSSFGFGGMDAAIVLGGAARPSAPRPRPRGVVVTGVAAVTPNGVFAGESVADLVLAPLGSSRVSGSAAALDPERSRRLDPISRLATLACSRALGAEDPAGMGIILGNAFGLIDATAELMKRFEEKGARMVRPADFPGLVPSSPAGHISIYLGLTGPALVVADHAASGECAFLQAHELIAAGDAARICAGAAEDKSALIERHLTEVFGEGRYRRSTSGTEQEVHLPGEKLPRAEGSAFVVLAAETPGGQALARAFPPLFWTDDPSDGVASLSLPEPPPGAVVVAGTLSARAEATLDASSWRGCERIVCAESTGSHEATGAIAIAVAVAKILRGAPAALYIGFSRGRGYAGTLWPMASERRP